MENAIDSNESFFQSYVIVWSVFRGLLAIRNKGYTLFTILKYSATYDCKTLNT